MRTLAALGVLSVLVLASAQQALALPKPNLPQWRTARAHKSTASPRQRMARFFLAKHKTVRTQPTKPQSSGQALSALELDIVGRINAQRRARGMKALRVSVGLTAAAAYHCNQMGLLGFFEHESHNGAPFWKRIERFYPAGRGYWSVGENIFWESPDTSAASAVHEWMASPPHRQNILTREWRDIGVAAVHFPAAPGAFGGRPVTVVNGQLVLA